MFSTKSALFGALIVCAMGVQVNQSGAAAAPKDAATKPADQLNATPDAKKDEPFHSYLDFCFLCDSFKFNPKDKGEANPNVNADNLSVKTQADKSGTTA